MRADYSCEHDKTRAFGPFHHFGLAPRRRRFDPFTPFPLYG